MRSRPSPRILACTTLATLSLLLPELVSAKNRTCYYPASSVATNDTPCNESAEHSACCNARDVCLDNNLCYNQATEGGLTTRASCTDSTWASDACPKLCSDVEFQKGTYLAPVDVSPGKQLYCCGTGYDPATKMCNISTFGNAEPFEIPAGLVITDRLSGATISALSSASTTTTTGSVEPTASATVACTSEVGSSSANGRDIAVGLGVGIPLALGLVAALAMLGRERSKRKSAERLVGTVRLEAQEKATPPLVPTLKQENPAELRYKKVHDPELENSQISELGSS